MVNGAIIGALYDLRWYFYMHVHYLQRNLFAFNSFLDVVAPDYGADPVGHYENEGEGGDGDPGGQLDHVADGDLLDTVVP